MKSDNDLQNSDNCVVLKTVSPQILDKLRESGSIVGKLLKWNVFPN